MVKSNATSILEIPLCWQLKSYRIKKNNNNYIKYENVRQLLKILFEIHLENHGILFFTENTIPLL